MTEQDIKLLIHNPLFLFFVMLLGALHSAMKQVRDARKNGADVTYGFYISHWPETVGALGYLLVSFLGLVETGTLNIASAWGLGYMSNSMADTVREGGRSASISPPKKPDSTSPEPRA